MTTTAHPTNLTTAAVIAAAGSNSSKATAGRDPTPAIDWSVPIGFKYRHPRSHVKYIWSKDSGTWDAGVLVRGAQSVTMDIA
ncbi:hypothetical protein HK100_004542, partial [Physocladia obscura]